MRNLESWYDRPMMRTVCLLAVGAALLIPLMGRDDAKAGQRDKKQAATTHLSGAERSVAVLKEISAKLSQIDARLERLERLAANELKQRGPRK